MSGKRRTKKGRGSNNIPGPSKKEASEENPSAEGSGPEPTYSKLILSSWETYCFSRILTPDDVMPTNPELYIEANQAISLFDSSETKFFLVYDVDKSKSYSMLFSHYVTWDFIRYSISADWETFVADHNLKAGDEISFYKFVDKNICDGYFYVLMFVAEDKRKKKSRPGPGSRSMPTEDCCLSKILTPHEVLQENPTLYLDPRDAIDLTGYPDIVQHDPGTYSKDLYVFDKDDRQYTMKLSHRANVGPETSYVLNTGWGTFLRTHGLKEGDRLVFYRFFEENVYKEDYYYALRLEPYVAVTSPSSDVASDNCTVELQRKLEHLEKKVAEPYVAVTSPSSNVTSDNRTVELQRNLEHLKKKKAEELTALVGLYSLLEKAAEAGRDDDNENDDDDDDDVSGGAN